MERTSKERGKKMNKGVGFILTIVVLVTMFVSVNTGLTFVDNITVRECEVECLVNNVAYFCDTEGNVWGWECDKREGYHLGQKVCLVMNTNNTKELKDDFILKIKLDR